MPTRGYDQEQVYQDLLEWLDTELRPSYDITDAASPGDRFVPIGRIEDHFRKDGCEHSRRLLRATFPEQDLPVRPQNVAERCCRVFCILLRINSAHHIGTFVRYPNLWDEKLPFNPDTPPSHFPRDPDRPNFFSRFYEEQWGFCAPKIYNMLGVRFEKASILPIVQLSEKGGGFSSTVYRAVIHEKHDMIEQGSQASHDRCYAIKTYKRPRAQRDYEKESAAFNRITEAGTRRTPGIIGFYGSFEYRGSFNLLLEYADQGTLEQFFSRTRPSGVVNIIAFWKSLFEIIKGVWWIHDHHLPISGSEEPQLQQGWHQDLKPPNILVLSSNAEASYEGVTFKIADFGLSHFKTIMEGRDEAVGLDAGGTSTYGAPECYGESSFTQFRRHNLVKRSVDIWSLGCIFSEAATWVVKGNSGLQQYRNERAEATGRIQGFRGGDCFHNGKSRLPFVDSHHLKLRKHLDDGDCMTGRVLEIMVNEMLREKTGSRPTAEQLDGKAEEAIDSASQTGFVESPTPLPASPSAPAEPTNVRWSAHFPHRPSVLGGDRFVNHSPVGTLDLRKSTNPNQIPSPPETPTRHPGPSETNHNRSLSQRHSQGIVVEERNAVEQPRSYIATDSTIHGRDTRLDTGPIRVMSVRSIGGPSSTQVPSPVMECPLGCGMSANSADVLEQHIEHCEGDRKRHWQQVDLSQTENTGPIPRNVTRPASMNFSNNRESYGQARLSNPIGTLASSNGPLSEIREHFWPSGDVSNPRNPPAPETSQQTREIPNIPTIQKTSSSEIPFCSLKEAEDWYKKKKDGDEKAELPDDELRKELRDRDHIFFVDDSRTMSPRWDQVCNLAKLLTYITKNMDPDGVELYFLSSLERHKFKHSTGLWNAIKNHQPKGRTSLNQCFDQNLRSYAEKIEHIHQHNQSSFGFIARARPWPRRRSIYVLTDGALELGEKTQGHSAIQVLVRKLANANLPRRQVGIQFIRFGNDADGHDKLRDLDRLKQTRNLALDIVDTEPASRNVWKMLLGAINERFDEDEDDSLLSMTSTSHSSR